MKLGFRHYALWSELLSAAERQAANSFPYCEIVRGLFFMKRVIQFYSGKYRCRAGKLIVLNLALNFCKKLKTFYHSN
jgi:hypothetical protein